MADSHSKLLQNLKRAASSNVDVQPSQGRSTSRKLRTSRRFTASKLVRLQLVEVDGALLWEDVSGVAPSLGMFRRRGGPAAPGDDEVIADLEFQRLPPSKITKFLQKKDAKFNPKRGLRKWDTRTKRLTTAVAPTRGRALVLVHGTFSSGDHFISEFQSMEGGKQFLHDAAARYNKQVFVFDHATLSVGPILNAVDLDWAFAGSTADIDVICHSRGGLVARWWCEHLSPGRCRRVMLVGSPLAGTGLAAPPNIRATINLLTEIGNVVGKVAGLGALAVPVLSVVEVLLNILTSITSVAAKTPVVDAAIAMVPGLFAMSRVGNNPELLRLLSQPPYNGSEYYAVSSNFTPDDPKWRFWRWFRKDQLADVAADVIFKADNDLVVDTTSMSKLTDTVTIPRSRRLEFKKSPMVHHLNYFRQDETIAFLRKHLSI